MLVRAYTYKEHLRSKSFVIISREEKGKVEWDYGVIFMNPPYCLWI